MIETITWSVVASVIWLAAYQLITIINGAPLF